MHDTSARATAGEDSTAGVRQAEIFEGAGGSALCTARLNIGSCRRASDLRLGFSLLPEVETVCHHCDKLVKDKLLNGFLLAMHPYNCGRCQGWGRGGRPRTPAGGGRGGADSASQPGPRAASTEGHSEVAVDGEK